MSLIISFIITHPLILVQFYWILYVMWKLTGQLSRNNACLRWHLSSDFPLKRNTVSTRVSNIPSSYFTWKETKLALLSLAIVILNSWLQMLFSKVHQVFEFLIWRALQELISHDSLSSFRPITVEKKLVKPIKCTCLLMSIIHIRHHITTGFFTTFMSGSIDFIGEGNIWQ